ncbi:hypothetical protein [Saccharopolyspora griseoalba]|uniref:SMODS-associated and fused to various effectors domain-containing protein n=1 Tax=Saccharopolyspora griseoalba TaxID=1431848 RepID=A0ABW2LRN9_9PSEU
MSEIRVRSFLRRSFPSGGQWWSALANVAVVVLAAAVTALLALIVEDLLPMSPPSANGVVWQRRWWLIGVLVALVAGVVGRTVHKSARGTLFYVQFLEEGMKNWHTRPLGVAKERHLAVKWVLRWVSLARRTDNGVIDLVEPCAELAHTVQSEVNADTDDSGFTLATNTLWPVSLALGWSLSKPDRLTLLDFADKAKGGKDPEYPLMLSKAKVSHLRHECLEMKPPTGDRVGVWVALTQMAAHCDERNFRKFGVGCLHRITFHGYMPGDPDYEPTFGKEELEQFGWDVAQYLHDIKKQAGSRELVVIAMMPKTTALVTGWHLSRMPLAFFQGTHLMHYDMVSKHYIPMRVFESQPTVAPSTGEAGSARDDHVHA